MLLMLRLMVLLVMVLVVLMCRCCAAVYVYAVPPLWSGAVPEPPTVGCGVDAFGPAEYFPLTFLASLVVVAVAWLLVRATPLPMDDDWDARFP